MSTPEKQELFAQLEELGVEFKKQFGVKRLTALLEEARSAQVVSEVAEAISEEVAEKSEVEEEKEKVPYATNDESVVPVKPIIPEKNRAFVYASECSETACVVLKKRCKGGIVYNEGSEFVREYSLEGHGDNFKALADMFVNKRNK